MSDMLTRRLLSSSQIRRLAWRFGRRLYCAARGEESVNAISGNGESYIQACAIKAMPAGQKVVVVDIGANQGEWTASLLGQLPPERNTAAQIQIELFEPVPSTAATLQQHMTIVDKASVTHINQAAVSDAPGTARMVVLSATGGTNSLNFDSVIEKTALDFVDVAKITLTQYCSDHNIAHIHLAKCDTEGHDLSVLRGARDLLAAGRIDLFQFEYNHRWVFARSFLKDVFEMIEGLPYRLARIHPTGIEIFESWHPEVDRFFQCNYLLVREPAQGWFNVRHGHFDDANTYA